MNENYKREIDLVDLLADWISHWRSFLIFLLVGGIIAAIYGFNSNNTQSTVAVNAKDLLTINETAAVDGLIKLNDEWLENLDKYEKSKDSMNLNDRTEVLYYLNYTNSLISNAKSSLSDNQRAYFLEHYNDVSNDNAGNPTTNTQVSKTTIIFIILFAIAIHFILIACNYVFDGKIKHTDSLTSLVSVPEYTRMVNWNCIDSHKGLDKIVDKMRFSDIRRTSLADVVEINATSTIEKMKTKGYTSIAVIGAVNDERQMLVNQISVGNNNIIVKSIDSITHSVNGADDICGVDSAILVVKVAKTPYIDFLEELQSLRDRDVDVIGVAIFE